MQQVGAGSGRKPPQLDNGRYTIVGGLGRGGTASVYLAYDNKLRIWKAIKVLSYKFIDDEQVLRRFQQEAQTMARLQSKHIVRVFDIQETGYTPFISMEFCESGAITTWMKRNGRMPPMLACEVLLQVIDGLAAAHEEGIVHRDIKPQNMLVTAQGEVKLTDFGIAQVHEDEDDKHLTQAGSTLGTLAFMAPEQRNDSVDVDGRADVYALGATLYTMLTLKTSTELFLAEPGDKILDGIPDPLVHVMTKAVQYDRDDRYLTVREMGKALKLAMHQLDETPADTEPLNARALQLPRTPPDELEEGVTFDELDRALALEAGSAYGTLNSSAGPSPAPASHFDDSPTHPEIRQMREAVDQDSQVDQKVIPYFMPTSAKDTSEKKPSLSNRKSDAMPSYLAQEEVQRLADEEQAKKDKKKKMAKLAKERAKAKKAEKTVEKVNWAPLLLGAFALFAVGGSIGGGIVYAGSSSVSAAQSEANSTSKALLRSISENQSVIDDIASLGGERARLESLYLDMGKQKGGARGASALKFAENVEIQVKSRATANTGPETQRASASAQDKMGIIRSKAEAYQQARQAWEDAAGSPLGAIAIAVGMADAPD